MNVKSPIAVTASVLDKAVITATHLKRVEPGYGFIDAHVVEDAFMMSVRLRDYDAEVWSDGRRVAFPTAQAGSFTLYDYNETWTSDIRSPFDNVSFHIPRVALAALEDDLGGKPIETLRLPNGITTLDPTVRGLIYALLPAFNHPREISRLFLDHITLALSIHMAVSYGGARAYHAPHPGGLSDWQLKAAFEIIDANLDGNLSLGAIAHACKLSPAYFSRAFKTSVGTTPHRWMLARRIDKAKQMMRTTNLSLAEIGALVGFQDQSHFSRVFTRVMGRSARLWRQDS